jgi:hypothetical protein
VAVGYISAIVADPDERLTNSSIDLVAADADARLQERLAGTRRIAAFWRDPATVSPLEALEAPPAARLSL